MQDSYPTTKKRPVFVLATLLVSIAAIFTAHALRAQTRQSANPLVGAWRLTLLEQPGPHGEAHRITCCGMLVFTRDGHISVQVMDPNPQTQASNQYSQKSYEASYGTYQVIDAHTFTFHVDGALVRTLIGKDLPRAYELSGNQLIVRSTRADEHWRVVWERY